MSSLLKDRCLVNGEWVAAASGNTFDVVNPVNGKVIGSVPDMNADDTQKAIDAAAEVIRCSDNMACFHSISRYVIVI